MALMFLYHVALFIMMIQVSKNGSEMKKRGVLFYPVMIMTFLEHIVTTYVSNACTLSDGREGTIVFINKDDLAHPIVQIGNSCVNLARTQGLEIVKLM